jgi:hypothetical protein
MYQRIFMAGIFVIVLALFTGIGAADDRIEIAAEVGYTFSEGIEVSPNTLLPNVKKVSPRNSLSYGANAEYYYNWGVSFGFLWNLQDSELGIDLRNAPNKELADMTVSNYHFVFTYHVMNRGSKVRPFVQGGLGWTTTSVGSIMGVDTDSESQFSTIWGGGVKYYHNERMGIKLTGRWTPTYVKSDDVGYWCNYYGCWAVGDPDYINQLAITAAIFIRG